MRSLAIAALILTVIASSFGLFLSSDADRAPIEFVNQYGDNVLLAGKGLYAHDSYFRAPISRGTDAILLFLISPLLCVSLFLDQKRKTPITRLFLLSLLGVTLYYGASQALGVSFNILHLVYTALLSTSLLAIYFGKAGLDSEIMVKTAGEIRTRGATIFLALTGAALTLAWLPDILGAHAAGRAPALIEVYTTEITYVLDMGIISPICLVCIFFIKRKDGRGPLLFSTILVLCAAMGLILPMQTIFQLAAGIDLPIPVLVTKAGTFIVLAAFAVALEIRLLKGVRTASGRSAATP